MLHVSESAIDALQEARDAQEVPASYGVRVFAQADDVGEATVALAFADQPVEGDEIIQKPNTDIYVAAELAEPLAESVMDVEDGPDGPQLAIKPQDEDESGPEDGQ